MPNDSTKAVRLQDPKFDWRKGKLETYRLSKLYELAGMPERSRKVAFCSTFPEFGVMQNGRKRLVRSNFCKDRLCPVCSSFKARKQARELSQILDVVEKEHPEVRYTFLTLTVRSMSGEELPDALKALSSAWFKLIRHRAFERAVGGWFRSIEITRNREKKTYHPHIHAVLAVPVSYFDPASGLYLTHDWFIKHWAKACGIDYAPSLRIQRARAAAKATADAEARGKSAEYAAALEASKYPIKTKDYIQSRLPEAEAVQVVSEYATAVKGRRFTAYGGWLKAAAAALKLDEPDSMEHLADIHDGTLRDDLVLLIETYSWSFGAKDYVLESVEDSPDILSLRAGDADADPEPPALVDLPEVLEGVQMEIDTMPPKPYKFDD